MNRDFTNRYNLYLPLLDFIAWFSTIDTFDKGSGQVINNYMKELTSRNLANSFLPNRGAGSRISCLCACLFHSPEFFASKKIKDLCGNLKIMHSPNLLIDAAMAVEVVEIASNSQGKNIVLMKKEFSQFYFQEIGKREKELKDEMAHVLVKHMQKIGSKGDGDRVVNRGNSIAIFSDFFAKRAGVAQSMERSVFEDFFVDSKTCQEVCIALQLPFKFDSFVKVFRDEGFLEEISSPSGVFFYLRGVKPDILLRSTALQEVAVSPAVEKIVRLFKPFLLFIFRKTANGLWFDRENARPRFYNLDAYLVACEKVGLAEYSYSLFLQLAEKEKIIKLAKDAIAINRDIISLKLFGVDELVSEAVFEQVSSIALKDDQSRVWQPVYRVWEEFMKGIAAADRPSNRLVLKNALTELLALDLIEAKKDSQLTYFRPTLKASVDLKRFAFISFIL